MTEHVLPPAIRYLPLLPRTRPPALPPRQRLDELQKLLHRADTVTEDYAGLVAASEVMNKAALLASDTGHSDLAAALCWRHYDGFIPAAPLTAKVAKLALQPMVNLGRLAIRTGDPTAAYTVFEELLAATDDGCARVLGRTCQVGDLVTTPEQRAELRRFTWMVMLADGTRALCAAGRWRDALDHLHRHNGIGRRLWDGRQVAVLAALRRRDPDTAAVLLEETHRGEAWEQTVAACLTTATCLVAGSDPTEAVTTMVDAILRLPSTLGGDVFAARMGVLACELAPGHHGLITHLVAEVMETLDAHVASVLLGSAVVTEQLTTDQKKVLRTRVEQAELTGLEHDDLDTQEFGSRVAVICDEAINHLAHRLRQVLTHS